jgi:hypothetical protein
MGSISPRRARRLLAAGLAVALGVVACGGSSSATGSPGPSASADSVTVGGQLTPGLSANLDTLSSYQFTESNVGAADAGSSPSDGGSYLVSGTVVNQPVASILVKETRAQFVVIGNLGWVSVDGATWMSSDVTDMSLSSLLPGSEYAAWFDAKASYFNAVGDESKNGVPCVHYKGSSTLASIYGGASGASSNFQADVWIAKGTNYPVSGVFGFSDATASAGGSWGFKFDITNVDDDSNKLAAPTNVVAYPT